jgi:hypothetical protein
VPGIGRGSRFAFVIAHSSERSTERKGATGSRVDTRNLQLSTRSTYGTRREPRKRYGVGTNSKMGSSMGGTGSISWPSTKPFRSRTIRSRLNPRWSSATSRGIGSIAISGTRVAARMERYESSIGLNPAIPASWSQSSGISNSLGKCGTAKRTGVILGRRKA